VQSVEAGDVSCFSLFRFFVCDYRQHPLGQSFMISAGIRSRSSLQLSTSAIHCNTQYTVFYNKKHMATWDRPLAYSVCIMCYLYLSYYSAMYFLLCVNCEQCPRCPGAKEGRDVGAEQSPLPSSLEGSVSTADSLGVTSPTTAAARPSGGREHEHNDVIAAIQRGAHLWRRKICSNTL